MQFIMKHFPFLFILIFIFSCSENNVDEEFESEYSKIREYARKLEDEQKIDSAFYYLNLIPQKFPDEIDAQVYAKLEQARLYQIICDFAESEAIATEAIAINKNRKYDYYLYNMLGTAYEEQSNYAKAIDNYQLAFNSTNKKELKIVLKNNIGVVYLDQGNYSKAIQILEPLLKLDTLKRYSDQYARVIDNLGFSYFKKGISEKAVNLLEESLKIRDSLGNEYDKIASLIHLSNFYKDSNFKLSHEYAEKALESANKINSPDDKLESLALLINLTEPNKSKEYFKKYVTLKDSITKQRQIDKNQFANIKYDSRIAKEESENQKKQKIIYLLLFILSICIALAVLYIIRKRNKEREEKISYETETRISKRLHDELANDVFNTITFIDTQDLLNPNNKEVILQDLDAIYDKTRNISKQTSEVITGKTFDESLNQLFMSYTSEQVNIMVQGLTSIDWGNVKENKQIEIYRVLNELLVNMKKHSGASLVVIRFESALKNIQIKYSDNGKGFEKEKVFKNGLLNVENRILSIKGKITFDSETNKGVKVNIEFPK